MLLQWLATRRPLDFGTSLLTPNRSPPIGRTQLASRPNLAIPKICRWGSAHSFVRGATLLGEVFEHRHCVWPARRTSIMVTCYWTTGHTRKVLYVSARGFALASSQWSTITSGGGVCVDHKPYPMQKCLTPRSRYLIMSASTGSLNSTRGSIPIRSAVLIVLSSASTT